MEWIRSERWRGVEERMSCREEERRKGGDK